MTDPAALAEQRRPLGDEPVPAVVRLIAGTGPIEVAWRNELGGTTYRAGDVHVKWNPRTTGIDLARERDRLAWISARHPAPPVLDWGEDAEAQWLVTRTLPGGPAVGDEWRARPHEAIRAIATGLRALHAIPTGDFPGRLDRGGLGGTHATVDRAAAADILDPVIVHGDACAPNTLITPDGAWRGNVDFGDLAVGERWADLAIASLSLDWNFGEGHQGELYAAYGIAPDEERIAWYRALWHLES